MFSGGLDCTALGPKRRETLVHVGPQKHYQRPVLLTESLLVVRGNWSFHQNLGKCIRFPGANLPVVHTLRQFPISYALKIYWRLLF